MAGPLRRAVALTLGSKLAARLMFAALLVFGTYNPTAVCYLRWLREGAADPVWKIVVSGVLAVAWGVAVPVSLRALGFGGVALTTVLATTSIWALEAAGLVDLAGPDAAAWVLLSVGAFVLGDPRDRARRPGAAARPDPLTPATPHQPQNA
jgi:hypothetical protein